MRFCFDTSLRCEKRIPEYTPVGFDSLTHNGFRGGQGLVKVAPLRTQGPKVNSSVVGGVRQGTELVPWFAGLRAIDVE